MELVPALIAAAMVACAAVLSFVCLIEAKSDRKYPVKYRNTLRK